MQTNEYKTGGRTFKHWFSACVIDYFQQLVYDSIFAPSNVVHMECIWFVYAHFLQHKLDEFKNEWNIQKDAKFLVFPITYITYLN